MSFLFVVVIGAVTGWVAGQVLKGSEYGVGLDFAAGAVGGAVAVVLSRWFGPAAASGILISFIVTVIGATATLYAMRRVLAEKLVPERRRPRRR